MIFSVSSYGGYQHSGENKLLSPHATLEQAHSLEYLGLVGIVPHAGETQLGPFSDMNRDGAKDGFVAELTQGGVLVDPKTGRANVVAFTIDVVGQDDSGEIWLSDGDELSKSEGGLDPNKDSAAEVEGGVEDGEEAPESTVSIAGIAMPAMGKLLVVQMIPELPQGSA